MKTEKLGYIEIKPAKNGFLVICNNEEVSVDPAQDSGFKKYNQDIYVHTTSEDTLIYLDEVLRKAALDHGINDEG